MSGRIPLPCVIEEILIYSCQAAQADEVLASLDADEVLASLDCWCFHFAGWDSVDSVFEIKI